MHRAKYRCDRSNRYQYMVSFSFFKMAAVRYLELLKFRNFDGRRV